MSTSLANTVQSTSEVQISSSVKPLFANKGMLHFHPGKYVAHARAEIRSYKHALHKKPYLTPQKIAAMIEAFTAYEEQVLEWLERHNGAIPESWVDADQIIHTYLEAHKLGISLETALLAPGLDHPSPHVRRAAYLALHHLNEQQKTALERYLQQSF